MNKKILILSSQDPKKPGVMQSLSASIKNRKKFHITTYMNVAFILDAVTNNSTIYIDDHIANLSGVYFRVISNFRSLALPLAQLLKQQHIPFVNTILGNETSDGKALDYTLLFNHLPIPKTCIAYPEWIVKNTGIIQDNISSPFILKTSNGKMGLDNYLITDTGDLKKILSRYSGNELFCIQEFIPNECDYRIIVVGYEAKQIYSRTRSKSSRSHLNNVTQGAKRTNFKVSSLPEICSLAEKAAKLLNRDICGVDVIKDSLTGNLYILEVNSSSPGLPYRSSHQLIGTFLEKKFLSDK